MIFCLVITMRAKVIWKLELAIICPLLDLASKHVSWWFPFLASLGCLVFCHHCTRLSPTSLSFSTLLRFAIKFPLALLIKVRDLNPLNKWSNSIYESINVLIRPSVFSQSFFLPIYQSFLQFFIILIAILPLSRWIISSVSQSLNHLFFSLHKLTN